MSRSQAVASLPPWRSLLFTPGDAADKLADAATRGADAVIIDLEDAVAAARKAAARAGLAGSIAALSPAVGVAVRINAPWREAVLDVEAAVRPGVTAIVAPKAERAGDLAVLSDLLGEWEAERGLPVGGMRIIALIESPAGLLALREIAGAPRVAGLALGSEDFCARLGVVPTMANLGPPCRMIALAAAAQGLAALGTPLSIAAFRDPAALAQAATAAREMGMTGALCIHPDQVAAANAAFAVTPEARRSAERILDAWRERSGEGVFALDGLMIDVAVVRRAEALLRRPAP